MADYTIVDQVSRALEATLTAALADVDPIDPPRAERHNLKPPPTGQRPILTLFLYEITEDPTLRNRDPSRELVPGAPPSYRMKKPPLALVLRYLVTAWANRRDTEHLMIGRTLQVLYEQQVHRGAALSPELSLDAVAITLAPLTLEERTRVWWSIQEPYRLSLNYEVRVVDLDVRPGAATTAATVRERALSEQVPGGSR